MVGSVSAVVVGCGKLDLGMDAAKTTTDEMRWFELGLVFSFWFSLNTTVDQERGRERELNRAPKSSLFLYYTTQYALP